MGKFENILIESCVPTLAGIKPANLFVYQVQDKSVAIYTINLWRKTLATYGLTLKIAKYCKKTNSYLLYLYREDILVSILNKEEYKSFLAKCGYNTNLTTNNILQTMFKKLCTNKQFPHEIGIFLGYPLCDVIGFIENKGKNYTCCGYWKSYSDPNVARELFNKYKHCTNEFKNKIQNGSTITDLIKVA